MFSSVPILIFLIILMLIIPLVARRAAGGYSSRSAGFLFSPIVIFPLAFAIYYGGGYLLGLESQSPTPTSQVLYYLGGLASYLTGVLCSKRFISRRLTKVILTRWRRENQLIFIIAIPCGLAAMWLFYKMGVPIFSDDVQNNRTQSVHLVGGWVYYGYRTLSLVGLLVLMRLKRRNKFVLMQFCVLLCVVALLGASGYRTDVAVLLFTLLVFQYYQGIMINKRKIIKLLPVVVVLIIGSVAFALWRRGEGLHFDALIRGFSQEICLPVHNFYAVTQWFPDVYPYMHGKFLFNGFLALLPGEQLSMGIKLKEMMALSFSGGGFAPSLLGGFFIDFGVLGIIVGMFCLGVLMQVFFSRMCYSTSDYNRLLYSYLCAYSLFFIRNGMFTEIFPFWGLILIGGVGKLVEQKVAGHEQVT